MTVQLNNKEFEVENNDSKTTPYKLFTEKAEYSGMKKQTQPGMIVVMDKSFRKVGIFNENTMKQVV